MLSLLSSSLLLLYEQHPWILGKTPPLGGQKLEEGTVVAAAANTAAAAVATAAVAAAAVAVAIAVVVAVAIAVAVAVAIAVAVAVAARRVVAVTVSAWSRGGWWEVVGWGERAGRG